MSNMTDATIGMGNELAPEHQLCF